MRRIVVLTLAAMGTMAVLHAAFGTTALSSETAPTTQETEGVPHIVFEETEHDFGTIGEQQTVKHNFKFRNEGDATLVIENIKTTCGCTGTLLSKKEILPGEEGNIEVTFKSGSSGGKKKKNIFVYSNDPQHPSSELSIRAKVLVPVEVRPRSLYWTAERNAASVRTVQLLYQPDLDIQVTGLELSSPAFSASLRPKADVKTPRHDIEIRYEGGLPVGNFHEVLTILTDNPEYSRVEVRLRGKVMGPVRVVPNAVTLGVIKDDLLPTRIIRVYAPNIENFEITGVESTSPIISAEFTKEEASNRYQVKIALTAKPPVGAFSEKLLIKTNDLSENPIEVPVYAVVR